MKHRQRPRSTRLTEVRLDGLDAQRRQEQAERVHPQATSVVDDERIGREEHGGSQPDARSRFSTGEPIDAEHGQRGEADRRKPKKRSGRLVQRLPAIEKEKMKRRVIRTQRERREQLFRDAEILRLEERKLSRGQVGGEVPSRCQEQACLAQQLSRRRWHGELRVQSRAQSHRLMSSASAESFTRAARARAPAIRG